MKSGTQKMNGRKGESGSKKGVMPFFLFSVQILHSITRTKYKRRGEVYHIVQIFNRLGGYKWKKILLTSLRYPLMKIITGSTG